MKRLLIVATLAVLLALGMTGVAMANYGPHGGYLVDTDACAGCHRAHTAMSSVTWSASSGEAHSALLVSTATTMMDFCYACHGNNAPGAATNVQGGVLDTAILGDSQALAGEVGKTLNGGGFSTLNFGNPLGTTRTYGNAGGPAGYGTLTVDVSQRVATSQHDVDGSGTWGVGSQIWGSWGPGTANGEGASVDLNCTNCHDPHGSSNYRILNDSIQNRTVGGYAGNFASDPDPDPQPWVISNELGYPNGVGGADLGFRLHKSYWHYDGVMGVPYPTDYMPDYTNAAYAWPVGGLDPARGKGMSGWCTRGCHDQYMTKVGNLENPQSGTNWGTDNPTGQYKAVPDSMGGNGTFDGTFVRHRHPINMRLSDWGSSAGGDLEGDRDLILNPRAWQAWNPAIKYVDIPVLHQPVAGGQGSYDNVAAAATAQTNDLTEDGLDCLTCHRAHGTDARMSGYANSEANINPSRDSGIGGTPPTNDSALLRADNRGVCERCHNK